MTDKDSKEREALRSIGEEQAFEAWFKVDCPVEGANAKIAAKAAWKARASLAVSAGNGPLVGQLQAMPDLTKLTERGAKAWAGVDAQGLRDGVASAGSEPVATIKSWTNGSYWRNYNVVFHRDDLPVGTDLYTHPSVGGWISVDERLPPPFEEVVVYPRPDDYCCEAFCDTAGNWKWAEYEHNFGVHHRGCQVEYWLMLPEVPAPPTSSADSRNGE